MAGLRKPILSPSTKASILRDHIDNKMTSYALGKKYSISDVTAMKVIKELPDNFNTHPLPMIEPLELRAGMSVAVRIKVISAEALNVVDLALQAMKRMLLEHHDKLNASALTQFVSAAAPYVLAKADGKKKDEKQTMSSVFTMFKDNVNKSRRN